jgi:dimethylglycine dehydrogenase
VAGATSNAELSERFFVFGSGIAERYYERYFDKMLAGWVGDEAWYRTCGYELAGLSIAGPKSRQLLERCVTIDVSNDSIPFMEFRRLEVGFAPTITGRLTFTGDLGYEFWVPSSYQRYLFDLLMENGRDLGIQPFGADALESLRLEKSFGSWAREYRPIYDPLEAGLGRFIHPNRAFVGAAALSTVHDRESRKSLRTWVLNIPDGPDAADVLGDEPIWYDNEVVGWVTSGGYAHHSGQSVALGYIPAELAARSDGWHIEVLGVMRSAVMLTQPLFDPMGDRMRS